ncbi:MAG: zinc ABC transporter substrate-binding protein [Actinobacteria bacterium]|nr:zinc ABC transporter substrate-binding protein [Actinomycetota bacterium]MBU1608264.1 zinc ABC transporter substrate-binding protein [Actinomycetota bacterium]MBU2314478.1 zinc ABC transporter substrate-binding protein [Actinomycetota bacterium]MBU2384649.1 zinc ABC transporter substrate-binding protein [Actinomycetota bacterium]
MTSLARSLPALLIGSAAAVALAGCASPAPAEDADGLSIVASTNVYGDIAQSLAGDLATVTSIIDSAAIDPHSYEASAQDQLAIANADIVIENGGGYDPFVDVLVEGSGSSAIVISAVETSGLLQEDHAEDAHGDEEHAEDDHAEDEHADDHGHIEGLNEHVWYDVHSIAHVAEAITAALVETDAGNTDAYEENLDAFLTDLEALEVDMEALADALGGGMVAATEPVPVYLLAELGFEDGTPAEFSEAIEEGADVPPLALQQALDLIDSGDVRLLAYNEQTESPETQRVRDAAEAAGIAVVSFVETLPEGEDYVSWMRANVEAVESALTAA